MSASMSAASALALSSVYESHKPMINDISVADDAPRMSAIIFSTKFMFNICFFFGLEE